MRKLVAGPAREMIPFCLRDTFPLMKTAPGAAKMTPKKERTSAIINMASNERNSAHAPYFCAKYLCASSCRRNPIPTVDAAIAKIMRNPKSVRRSPRSIAKAREITIHALSKSRVSTMEDFMLFYIPRLWGSLGHSQPFHRVKAKIEDHRIPNKYDEQCDEDFFFGIRVFAPIPKDRDECDYQVDERAVFHECDWPFNAFEFNIGFANHLSANGHEGTVEAFVEDSSFVP